MIPPFRETSDLPACEQFTTCDGIDTELECAVCDHLELEHVKPGRRTLSSLEVSAQREKIIDISVAVEAARVITDQAFSDSEPST
jgi:hypothetical protein